MQITTVPFITSKQLVHDIYGWQLQIEGNSSIEPCKVTYGLRYEYRFQIGLYKTSTLF